MCSAISDDLPQYREAWNELLHQSGGPNNEPDRQTPGIGI
jgi:hypothetical protein